MYLLYKCTKGDLKFWLKILQKLDTFRKMPVYFHAIIFARIVSTYAIDFFCVVIIWKINMSYYKIGHWLTRVALRPAQPLFFYKHFWRNLYLLLRRWFILVCVMIYWLLLAVNFLSCFMLCFTLAVLFSWFNSLLTDHYFLIELWVVIW